MGAEDVRRHQVGRELYALGIECEDFGEGFDECGLAETGEAFQKNVSASEDAGEHEPVERGATEQHRIEGGEGPIEVCLDGSDLFGAQEVHGSFLSISKKRLTVPRCCGETGRDTLAPAERPPIAVWP